jgi:hypothetical protein
MLAASSLATLAALTAPIPAAHGQEVVRGLSLFPGRETTGVIPRVETFPHPDLAYTAGAVGATLVVFPFREAWCALGEFGGFIVGSVVRTMVWGATLGDQLGAGPTLERAGNTLVEHNCSHPLYVTADELRRSQVPHEGETVAR